MCESSPAPKVGSNKSSSGSQPASLLARSVDSEGNDPVINAARFLSQRFENHRSEEQGGPVSRRIPRSISPASSDSTPTTLKARPLDFGHSAANEHSYAASPTELSDVQSPARNSHWPYLSRAWVSRVGHRHADQRQDKETLLHYTYPPRRHVQATHSDEDAPVAVTTLFARKAAPLHLPYLDDYLARVPRPPMARREHQGVAGAIMFRPMERLEKLGKSLDDLEVNSVVVPFWRSRKTILGSGLNVAIGILGSSALAPFYDLKSVFNTVQIFALILSTIVPLSGKKIEDKWRKLFLGTIPNVLALNFASVLTQSLIFLVVFMVITSGFLYYFYRARNRCDRYNTVEGLQQTEAEGSRWGLIIVTFLLTVIYLPVSTMAVHVLVWSEDLWVVPNPYTNATSFPPEVPPLGPADEYKQPLDFCWTTTMKRNEINYAPIIVVLSVVIFASFTVWYPISLRRVIQQSVPKVDSFTELGRRRRDQDMDTEYQRLLTRDRNALAFLYNQFRRGWGTYESTYLFAKLSTLIVIAGIDPDNCLLRSRSRKLIPIIRQVLLLLSTIAFFVSQCIFAPFLDPVNNASEWTSRLNYVTTSTTALLIASNVPGKEIIDTYVLYCIYIITYGLSFYFMVINTSLVQRLIKRLTRRIDFSIDVFSPRLDLTPSSVHLKRRIWQETVSTFLFTDSKTRIPKDQSMIYAQARDSEYPPYLVQFSGSPAERHAENLKILREVGNEVYTKAAALWSGPDSGHFKDLSKEIQQYHVGPDCYWKNPREHGVAGSVNFFGNAWWIPFPPTLVIRHDDGRTSVLQDTEDLESYIAQNTSPDVRNRKYVRLCLRALENQVVIWPYDHFEQVGQWSFSCCGRRQYTARISTHFNSCQLLIKRRGILTWQSVEIGSGFDLELKYTKSIAVTGEQIGLSRDFDLTPSLARFLELNQEQIQQRSQVIEQKLFNYRRFHQREGRWKERVLSYRFLVHVYDHPFPDLKDQVQFEHDSRLKSMLKDNEKVFADTSSRYNSTARTETTAWWYIFWDDFWRRNYDTIPALSTYASDFNPHYPTSIAYTPLPRPILESFLAQRGLFRQKAKWNDWMHHGFLNKIYLRLNETVFTPSTGKSIIFHLGHGSERLDMNQIDSATRAASSTMGTGGGTDHNLSWIRTRPLYRWEGILTDPLQGGNNHRAWLSKLGAWLGLTPVWRGSSLTSGLAVDVVLDQNGRYVLLNSTSKGGGTT